RDLAAITRGAADVLAERAVDHARSRVQFPDHFQDLDGRDAIAKFGAVREHLAWIEAHRLALQALVEEAAWADRAATLDPAADPAGLEPRLAKIAVSRALGAGPDSIAYRAGQVIGGAAYSEDDVVAKLYRDSAVFPQWVRPNVALQLDIGRAIAALIRDGRPLGPLAAGVAPALEAADRRPILGELVRRLRAAERAVVEAAAPTLEALEADEPAREAVHRVLGGVAVDLYVWERLLARAHRALDTGRYSEPWVETVRLVAETVEERLVALDEELAWTPVRIGLGTHALDLGEEADVPPHTPVAFSYAKEIRGARRRYASGDVLLKPTELERVPYVPELVWCDADLRAYYETLRRSFRERFAETTPDGLSFERAVERRHHIPREHIDWARERGFFRTVIPTELGGEGRSKADYYNLCRVARRIADVSLTLTIQANTSIGTSPILIALEQDLPEADRELQEALRRPAAVADLRARVTHALDSLEAPDPSRLEPEISGLA
ncbi:MAG: acyl-CoA dehydrogenase family protein, partial [Gemmatimonadota bacterium]